MTALVESAVHHRLPDALVLHRRHGGFAICTTASFGGDEVAKLLLHRYASLGVAYVTETRTVDANGYVVCGLSGDARNPCVRQMWDPLRRTVLELFRFARLIPLAGGGRSVRTGWVQKRSCRGVIVEVEELPWRAVIPNVASSVEEGSAMDVCVTHLDVEEGVCAAVLAEGGLRVADVRHGETVGKVDVGAIVECRIVQRLPATSAAPARCVVLFSAATSLAADGTNVEATSRKGRTTKRLLPPRQRENSVGVFWSLAYLVQTDATEALEAPHGTFQALVEFSPRTVDEANDFPFILVSTNLSRAARYSLPTMRKKPEVDCVSDGLDGPFLWRDTMLKESNGAAANPPLMTKRQMEEELDRFERQKDPIPASVEEFDKLAMGYPNSSLLWSQYMAFHLALGEAESARLVADRALKTIAVTENQELTNIWKAYLNLEVNYGTPESVDTVFRRAVRHSDDSYALYEALASSLYATGKWEPLLRLRRTMSTKFSEKASVWTALCSLLIERSERDQLRRALKQLSKSTLKKKDQTLVLEHVALAEYRHGVVNAGRTLLESIIAATPRRSDVWQVFLQQEMSLLRVNHSASSADAPPPKRRRTSSRADALGSVEFTRELFRRAATMPFSPKAMQQLLQMFVSFEKEYGTPAMVEEVKERAREYVRTRLGAATSNEYS